MTPRRPYLIRAIYDWILDNGCTPHALVNAEYPGVQVPDQYVTEGRIVLNLSPAAVHGLDMGLDSVRFSARFGGRPMTVYLPVPAVMALYARENGQGMVFPDEEPGPPPPEDDGGGEGSDDGDRPRGRPSLKVVK